MVNQQFRIYAEQLVKQVLIVTLARFAKRAPRHIAHRVHSICFEFRGIAFADTPKIREWLMRPQQLAIAHLVELGDADAVFVGCDVLRLNVHCDFGKVKIRSDSGCCRDACVFQNILNQHHGHLKRSEFIGF